MKTSPRLWLATALGGLALTLAAGCGTILEDVGVREPGVSLDTTRLASLSLSEVDLLLGFEVDNPNPIGIRFDRFDYRFSIAGTPLASGDQAQGLDLAANGSSAVELPVSVSWTDLADIYRSVRGGETPGYTLDAGFYFNLPLLGPLRIPVKKEGRFPRVSLPKLSLSSLDVRRVTASGAELALELQLDNPNDFPFDVRDLDYALELGGQRVISTGGGTSGGGLGDFGNGLTGDLRVGSNGRETWTIPLNVDFARAGATLVRLLNGGGNLDYRLTGSMRLDSSEPWIQDTRLPVDATGRVNLR